MSTSQSSNPHADRLRDKIAARSAVVAVMGLGYVGLPMLRAMHDAGLTVIGYDTDERKIRALRAGEAYLKHLGSDWVADLARSPRFTAASEAAALADADAVIICVPTPLGPHRDPDLSYVRRSTKAVAETLRPGAGAGGMGGRLVILTSTSYPGTTREVCGPILERAGHRIGADLFLAFSPEREDPGRAGVTTSTIPRLVGGVDPVGGELALALLSAAVERVIPVESAEVAEAAKLLENIYRSVNIALVNELKPVLASMGIDVWQVIRAASTKPFGFQPFYPGPGLGGHCIPIDPFYLTWRAREFGHETRFIELAGEINSAMPEYVVGRVAMALNDDAKALRGSAVLVVGLAYKPNVDDVRETPAAEIIRLLAERGAAVSYHDPHVPRFPAMRKYRFDLGSVPLTPERLAAADCILIVTDHAGIDWELIGGSASLVVDTRNAMAAVPAPRARIVKA